ncbi:hypothetical protein EZV62_010884 [Acer yangbiense]|uniref:phosphoenolpyruvate carboxykinase (ATP) n=1 Tax=Acer yangbiense TaxID=1000413 RepID=A0A5C7I3T6_9ROSI|nr:hypothetical protein EZV62_010884 [Acer yangbiense]
MTLIDVNVNGDQLCFLDSDIAIGKEDAWVEDELYRKFLPQCLHCISKYTGEMKKCLFGLMHYLMPKRQILSLHFGCNAGKDGDVAFFFGLSGTGKTTLSTYHNKEKEPDIWNAIKFDTGNVVEPKGMIEIKFRTKELLECIAKGNIIEPEGMIEIKFRTKELLESMGRIDLELINLKAKLQEAKSNRSPAMVEYLQQQIQA